jgi:class 3 adenylate cyclase/tetratricopeptide (TPR) repeat protein
MKCPQCQLENPADARFCNECGGKLESTCPACGKTNPPGSKFCNGCGQNLKEPSTPSLDLSHPHSDTPDLLAEKTLTTPNTMEGERKHVTVLFSDLSGYTAMAEKLDPEEVKEITDKLFSALASVIERYGGFVEKYVGDAVMALFGVPDAHEDDPVRAVRAAREMHRLVAEMNPTIGIPLGTALSMHSGINTGLVVTGKTDAKTGVHGTAGDTVNVASRLCSLAKAGEILIGPETFRHAEGYFECEALTPIALKGKTETLRLFKLLSPKEKPLTVHRLSGIRARLTGRDQEMAELQEASEQLLKGKGAIISLIGDPGTGKSRLVEEFRKTFKAQWFEGHAYPYAQNSPFSLVRELLNDAFTIEEGDSSSTVREKLETRIKEITGDGSEIVPYVGNLYSLPYDELEQITPEHWKALLGSAVKEIFSNLIRLSPTIIVFEDLQWADPSSVDLLRQLLGDPPFSCLFLCAYRPQFSLFTGVQTAALGKLHREIRLNDLSSSESLQMVRSLLDSDTIPQDLQRLFQDRVQGNPFYLEEVVNGLVDSGALVKEGDAWRLTKEMDVAEISSTIYGVIGARLDLLDKEVKHVLQEASVIGRSFLYDILKKTTTLIGQCELAVTGLERLDFIRVRTMDPELEYIFKHALTQEVVYNGLLKKERKEIHIRVARVMEEVFKTRLPEFYEILAYHYSHGESPAKAVEYLLKSGEKSLARYAVDEADQYCEQAYQIASAKTEKTQEDASTLVDILTNWAYVFYYQGNFNKFLEVFIAHEKEAASLGNDAKSVMFYAWLGCAYFMTGKITTAYGHSAKARDMAEELGDRKGLGYALTWLSYAAGVMGKLKEALDAGNTAVEISKSFPSDQYLSFKGLYTILTAHLVMGDLRSALAESQALLDYGRRHSNNRSLVVGYSSVAFIHFFKGDPRSSVEYCRKAVDVARDPLYVLAAKSLLGVSYLLDGRTKEAEKEVREVIDFDDKFNCSLLAGPAHLFLAMVKIVKGQMGEGLKAMEKLRDMFFADGNITYAGLMAEQLLGEVYLKMVEASGPKGLSLIARNIPFLIRNIPFADKKARKHLEEAIRVAREVGAKGWMGGCYLDLGLLHRAKKRKEKARECLTEAVRLLGECEAEPLLKRAKEALESLGQPTGPQGGSE